MPGDTADIIFTNGVVHTVDAANSIAEAVAVSDGRILAAGSNVTVAGFAGAATRRVDLRGRSLTPGFIDAHHHFVGVGGATTTTFTWDIASGLPVVLDDGNQYVYVAGLVSMKQSGNWYYYLADGLSSTTAIVDSSGNSQKSYQYDVYGEVTGGSGSQSNEFDFAGQQTDGTGLQYLRARYYDPATGTFLSREPMARGEDWIGNHFTYAASQPTRLSDPSGLVLTDDNVGGSYCRRVVCGTSVGGGSTNHYGVGEAIGDAAGAVTGAAGWAFDRYIGWNPDSVNYWLTQVQLLDLLPIGEARTLAVMASTGGLGAPAAATCGGIELAVGLVAAAAFVAQGVMAGCDAHQMAAIGFTAGMSLGADFTQLAFGEVYEVGLYVVGTEIMQACGTGGGSPLSESGK